MIRHFLTILQTYKSSGAVEVATEWYNKYSQVNDYFLKVRELIALKKKPRRVELNNNLVRYNESKIEPQVYPECFEGIIKSYDDRYQPDHEFCKTMMEEWHLTSEHLRVKPEAKL